MDWLNVTSKLGNADLQRVGAKGITLFNGFLFRLPCKMGKEYLLSFSHMSWAPGDIGAWGLTLFYPGEGGGVEGASEGSG